MVGMKNHPDAAGRALAVDDIVMGTYGGMSHLTRMIVTGFTPKSVRCEPLTRLQAASGRRGYVSSGDRLTRSSYQVVLVETGDGTSLESRASDDVTVQPADD